MGMYIAKYQHFLHSVLKAETCNMIVRIANRDLDQITASEQSDIGLHYLPWLWLLSRQPMFEILEHLSLLCSWNYEHFAEFDHDSMKRTKMEFIIFIFYIISQVSIFT